MGIQDTAKFKKETFLGAGYVLINGYNVGNVVEASHEIEIDKKRLPSRAPGGGDYDTYEKINGVTASIVISDFNDENLAKALRAATVDIAAEAKTETIKARLGGLAPLAALVDMSQAVEVKSTDDVQTFAAGTDYEATDAGIIALEGGAITHGMEIKVSYNSAACTGLEMLAGAPEVVELMAYVKNEANGATHLMTYHKFVPDIMPTMPIFSDDFGTIPLTGTVLADETKGANLSKFMRLVKTPSQKAG